MPVMVCGGISVVVIGGILVYAMSSTGQTQTIQYDQETEAVVEDQGEYRVMDKWEKRRDRDLEPWMGLERGMTQEQVRSIFGEPAMHDESVDLIRWVYNELPREERFEAFTGGLRVDFDAKTKLVVAYIPPISAAKPAADDSAG